MDKWSPIETGGEAFVELLNANDVDCIFINPGTDTIPIQEALAKFRLQGKRTPEVVLCLHEQVAMAAAHGHFLVSGKPQVVLVHVDVGTQQVGGALHNAQRGRIGIVFCAGRSPTILEGEKPGGRDRAVMWWQETFDQAGAVRGYVKWDYELRFTENMHHVMQRAFQFASTEPCGPVYLSLPREVLMDNMEKVRLLDSSRYAPASTPQADTDLLEKAAGLLLQAEEPLIIAGHCGRNAAAVAALVDLAEVFSARVISSDYNMNFPTTHPLCHGNSPNPYFENADVILIVDHDIPYLLGGIKPVAEAKIIQIDIDPLKQDMPLWGFPVDISIQADSSKALPVLTGLIRQQITPEQKTVFQSRAQQLQQEHQQLAAQWKDAAVSHADRKPISPDFLCHTLGELLDEDTIIMNETTTSSSFVGRHIPRTKPKTIFGCGGSSLGWGLGAALGAKLAAPDKTVVSLVADGAFLYCCPTAALWASSVYRAPFLCVIFNNGGYNAMRKNIQLTYGADNFSEKMDDWVGLNIFQQPDYAMLAQANHGHGQMVEDPAELKKALQDALEQVRSGRSAVVDVRMARI